MRASLAFLKLELTGVRVDIRGDNEGTIAIADDPSTAPQSNHIDVKLHLIPGLIQVG